MNNAFLEQEEQKTLNDFMAKYFTENGAEWNYTKKGDEYVFSDFSFTLLEMIIILSNNIPSEYLLDFLLDNTVL